ncbi:hypothetical protein EC912_10738 [Luteibacter rhizovicinus]|uniref:Uncharacterized protein n=1 Tax=Luteibacter rhizovicinus TaxID=242606 RepID=A0A4R3YJR8_9GAMM|nr:hypothetical protein [Luteibacter rhizovicinus]TCV92332.1 hypothetical protein EC912_10738 [Luteibacter rhizovicinus]
MKLNLDMSGARMFGRRLAFALARRRADASARPRTITVPRSRHAEESLAKPKSRTLLPS